MGTVMLTNVGMTGGLSVWIIPKSMHNLCIGIGSINKGELMDIAIIISITSLLIACISASWTIYEKIFLRPRSKVTADISIIKSVDYESKPMVAITITNYGPGSIIIEFIHAEKRYCFGKMRKKNKYAFITEDYTNPGNHKLPYEISQYRYMTQFLPFEKDCILDGEFSFIGFKDSINRIHYISKNNMKELFKKYRNEFGE